MELHLWGPRRSEEDFKAYSGFNQQPMERSQQETCDLFGQNRVSWRLLKGFSGRPDHDGFQQPSLEGTNAGAGEEGSPGDVSQRTDLGHR